jgi:hypothetical protein
MLDETERYCQVILIELRQNARVLMTRDMELIKRILLEIEARKDLKPAPVIMEEIAPDILGRHIELIHEAGLLDATVLHPAANMVPDIIIRDLSWEGHEFVAALKNNSVWSKITNSFSASELAVLPITVLKDVCISLLKEWAKKKVGL